MTSKVSMIIVSAIAVISITSISYAISRYTIEQSKPGKEKTLQLANEAYDRNDYKSASSLYKRYIDYFDASNINVKIDYGYSLHNIGNSSEGIEILSSVLKIDSNNAFALFNLAVIYYQKKDVKNAVLWLTKCSKSTSSPEIAQRALTILTQLQTTNN